MLNFQPLGSKVIVIFPSSSRSMWNLAFFCLIRGRKYWPNIRFLVDGSNAGFVRQLKVVFGENPDYDYKDVSPETMEILPVNFGTEHKQMLSNFYLMVNEGLLAIPDKYEKLIISLRTCQTKDYSLDKEQTSYDDLLDGQRLSLKGYDIT